MDQIKHTTNFKKKIGDCSGLAISELVLDSLVFQIFFYQLNYFDVKQQQQRYKQTIRFFVQACGEQLKRVLVAGKAKKADISIYKI